MSLKRAWLATPLLLACVHLAEAQQPKMNRIGVLVPGEAWYEIVDGLRVGLKQLGIEAGQQIMLSIRDWKGDTKLAEAAVRNFQQEKVSLIYVSSTNSAIAAKRLRAEIPIVFCAGTDPVAVGLIESFAKPGGSLTGVYHPITNLTAKRLEILKDIVPKLRRVLTFHNAQLRTGIDSSKLAREAAQQQECNSWRVVSAPTKSFWRLCERSRRQRATPRGDAVWWSVTYTLSYTFTRCWED